MSNEALDMPSGIDQGLVDYEKFLSKPPELCECGGTFAYKGLGTYVCEQCSEVFKNEYAIVRDFVDKYGTSYSILEISEMTGVSKRIIDMLIKDGRFMRAQKQKVCIECHKPINSGFYCNQCALRQIGDAMEKDRSKKKISGTVRTGDLKGSMHYGRDGETYAGDRKR